MFTTISYLTTIAILLLSANVGAAVPSSVTSQAVHITANPKDTIGKEIGDYTLTDQDGKSFRLTDFRGKPYVLNLIYTSCDRICPTITMHLADAVRAAGAGREERFRVVTVGFDIEHDTPQKMKEYGKNFTVSMAHWTFASADSKTIDALSSDTGFYFKKNDTGFEHINMVTVVDAGGRIYKHVFGIDFKPEDILKPIDRSISGQGPEPAGDQGLLQDIILFCYKYDLVTGTYVLDYGHIAWLVAGIMIHVILIYFIVYILKSIRRSDMESKRADNPRS